MNIRLAKKNDPSINLDEWYTNYYKTWKKNMDKSEVGSNFFILYKDFDKYLKHISPGALKLYIYYGFSSNNETGASWHGVETISNYFGVSEKTINNWNNELIENGLICRLSRDSKRNKVTYLLPLSMTLIEISEIDNLKSHDIEDILGKKVKIYHLFQWRQSEGSSKNDKKYETPYHVCIIVFEKKFKGGIPRITAFECYLSEKEYDVNRKINKIEFSSDICRFETDLIIDDDIKTQGIAVNSKFNLKNKKIMYELIEELLDSHTNIEHYEEVSLD